MVERTESEVVTQAPLTVTLGGKSYEVAPLVIRDSRVWRAKVIDLIAPLPQLIKTTMDDAEGFGDVLKQIMVTMPDQIADLFFEYAKDLDRENIEQTATDAELAVAFEEVIKIAFPLAQSSPDIMKHLTSQK